jgi:Na+/melibiose symporter-like transporter
MPTYLQGVVGLSPTNSGSALIPLSLSMVFGAGMSGALTKKFGYKIWMLLGFALAVVGYLLLWRLALQGTSVSIWMAIVELLVVGLGIGFTLQTFIIAAQNAVEKRFVGVATSSLTLFRTLGATIGVTILGLVLNQQFVEAAKRNIDPNWLAAAASQPGFTGIKNLPNVLRSPDAMSRILASPGGAQAIEGIKVSFADAIAVLFIAAAGVALVAFCITLFIRNIRVKSAEEYHGEKPASAPSMH